MSRVVLDASALLAFLGQEAGAEVVAPCLPECVISSVSLVEVTSILIRLGHSPSQVMAHLGRLPISTFPLDETQILPAAVLHATISVLGFSLADAVSLALGQSLRAKVLTAHPNWAMLPNDLSVESIRSRKKPSR